jgi:formylmethanofuran dehydrogenase subunit E
MYRTKDPVADWDRYCAEEERELARLPVCSLCGNPIVDDKCYEIDEKIICPECLKEHYQKWTEDYIKEN